MNIGIGQNGSVYKNTSIHDLHYDLNEILEISIGPSDNYDGIKACLTYNSPGESKPGYQTDRGVRFHAVLFECYYFNKILSIATNWGQ